MSRIGSAYFSACLALAPFAGVPGSGQAGEVWVARYNEPGSAPDVPLAAAVDSQGNVYVTGHSTAPGLSPLIVTVKYDAAGEQLWTARYPNAVARSLALDGEGNVLIAGGAGAEFLTLKYDVQGNLLWEAREQ